MPYSHCYPDVSVTTHLSLPISSSRAYIANQFHPTQNLIIESILHQRELDPYHGINVTSTGTHSRKCNAEIYLSNPTT